MMLKYEFLPHYDYDRFRLDARSGNKCAFYSGKILQAGIILRTNRTFLVFFLSFFLILSLVRAQLPLFVTSARCTAS